MSKQVQTFEVALRIERHPHWVYIPDSIMNVLLGRVHPVGDKYTSEAELAFIPENNFPDAEGILQDKTYAEMAVRKCFPYPSSTAKVAVEKTDTPDNFLVTVEYKI